MTDNSEDELTLKTYTQTWADGIAAANLDAVEPLLSQSFYAALAVRGQKAITVTRGRFLQNVAEYQLESLTIDDLQVRVFGDVAVVTFLWTQMASWAGLRRDGQFYITDVWMRENGSWRMASHHTSRPDSGPVPPPLARSESTA